MFYYILISSASQRGIDIVFTTKNKKRMIFRNFGNVLLIAYKFKSRTSKLLVVIQILRGEKPENSPGGQFYSEKCSRKGGFIPFLMSLERAFS